MSYAAVMFDLDGTLADTLDDITAAGNAMLAALGRPVRPRDAYRYLAGQGVEYLVAHALGDDADAATIARGVALVRAYQDEHQHERARPYPGISELLDALTGRGLILAVLSNKPQLPTDQTIRRLFARWRFAVVRGARPDAALKPDPAAALAIADQLNTPPDRWVYLGDTRVDMLTGKSAGMFTIGATWGFRDEPELRDSGADAIIHEPGQMLDLI